VSFVVTAGGALVLHHDAVETNTEWLYWSAVWVVAAFYAVVALVYFVRFIRWLWLRWAEFARKARAHDGIQAELARWRNAAGAETIRADDAEKRLKTWHRDTLGEGRRRVLAEVRAATARTTFHDIEVAVAKDVLVIGAKWSDEAPQIDSRYVLRSATLKQPKAVLECVEIRENGTVVFRVPSVASDSYRADLLARASATGSVLTDVEIAARTDDLKEEAIWPER
jgi:hypothetical protein